MAGEFIKVGIVGGTGYTGVELLRLLVQHPRCELTVITSRTEAGMAVADMFPNLRGRVSLKFTEPARDALSACELVFFANAGTGATNLRTTQAATGGGRAAVRQSGIDSSFGIQAAVQVNRTTENRMHLGKEISAAFAAAPAGTAAGGWLLRR